MMWMAAESSSDGPLLPPAVSGSVAGAQRWHWKQGHVELTWGWSSKVAKGQRWSKKRRRSVARSECLKQRWSEAKKGSHPTPGPPHDAASEDICQEEAESIHRANWVVRCMLSMRPKPVPF